MRPASGGVGHSAGRARVADWRGAPRLVAMRIRAAELAAAVGGGSRRRRRGRRGARIDSRAVAAPASCSCPSSAERDGHDFVAERRWPRRRGGLPDRSRGRRRPGGTAIVVDDTRRRARSTSARLARDAPARAGRRRHRLGRQDVGEGPAAAAVLGQRCRTAASARSFNNELGVPLTLLERARRHRGGGRRDGRPGRRPHRRCCATSPGPTVGVVTAVAARPHRAVRHHRRRRRGQGRAGRGAARRRHRRAERRRARGARPWPRGPSPACSRYGAAAATSAPTAWSARRRAARPASACATPWGDVDVRARGARRAPGRPTPLAAAAAASSCGRRRSTTWPPGLAAADLSPWRMELRDAPSGARRAQRRLQRQPDVDGGRAAMRWPTLPAERRVAVLGLMAELGPSGDAEHRRDRRPGRGARHRRGRRRAPTPTASTPVADIDGAVAALGRSAPATPCWSRAAGWPASSGWPRPCSTAERRSDST